MNHQTFVHFFVQRLLLLGLALALAVFSVRTSSAEPHKASERTYLWLPWFIQPCEDYGVPLPLALAIARQESGTRPWVINVAGKDFSPKSPEEALEIAAQAKRAGKSFDVGIMQVNSYWLKKYHIDLREILDPQKNIAMGVWILAREIKRYGLTWKAIGAYHTPLARNPDRARRYAATVLTHMRAICDRDAARRAQAAQSP
ncbi:MAG: lytic transglycosylase domain-containing protein [Desulfovibrio sp.]|nr:lytic transglycosylase domain-containing protein [Desulfovibrio sp.]